LYDSKRWRTRSKQQLQAHPLCAFCLADSQITAATIANHVVPHRGNPALFYYGALQSLCRHHHDTTKQQIETRGYFKGVGNDGWPLDQNHPANKPKTSYQFSIPYGLRPSGIPVTLVCGPPCAGKSSWVKEHARAGDSLICLDECKLLVGGTPWDQDPRVV